MCLRGAYLIGKTARLRASSAVSASAAKHAAHKALTGKTVTKCTMNKCLDFNRTCLMHGRQFFKRQLSGSNHTGSTLAFQKFHSFRAGHSHLCTGMKMKFGKIITDKLKYSEVLHNDCIKSFFI